MQSEISTDLSAFAGMKVLVNDHVFPRFKEDWSEVRSPARAQRRRKRGFPQRIKIVSIENVPAAYRFADTLIVNSAMAKTLREPK